MQSEKAVDSEPIYVTKTFLPPLEEFIDSMKEIWKTHMVTNDGEFFQNFEDELRRYTEVEHLVCVGNGTLALQLAVRALELTGEVITTPFSHVASSGSLFWENCKPVYADIDPETLNLDPRLIEEKITENTTGILAVHVYSNPCDVLQIQEIATRNNLKVIYDAAHAFGAKTEDQSVFAFGDLSMASFNATKGFHTIEGGALFARSNEMVESIRRLAYFGMNPKKQIVQPYGTNAKLIEMCAAIGLINLKYFDSAMARKRKLYELYLSELSASEKLRFQKLTGEINYSYFPVIASSEDHKFEIIETLQAESVFPRQYFDTNLESIYSDSIDCPVTEDITRRVICMPMSDYLTIEQVQRICNITLRVC